MAVVALSAATTKPIPRSDEPCEMILTLILLAHYSKIRASTPVLPANLFPLDLPKPHFQELKAF
jgi:hypothetical protein